MFLNRTTSTILTLAYYTRTSGTTGKIVYSGETSPEWVVTIIQNLQERYQKLVLRVYQHDQIVQAKDEAIEQLKAQITPLRTTNE